MRKKLFKRNPRFYIAWGLILISLILTVTLYRPVLYRVGAAVWDVCTSFAYFFMYMLDKEDTVKATVTRMPELDIWKFLPFTLEQILFKLEHFWEAFFTLDNFLGYLIILVDFLSYFMMFMSTVVPCLALLFVLVFSGYAKDHVVEKELLESDSKWRIRRWFRRIRIKLKAVRKKVSHAVSEFTYKYGKIVSDFLKSCAEYYKEHSAFVKWFAFLWILNTNILTVALEVLAYYYYFICSADLASILTQMGKLLFDVIIMLWTLPFPVWVLVCQVFFEWLRRRIGLKRLLHMEAKTRGFIKSFPIVAMITGTMGKGKTKTMVDMALSKEHEFRDKAIELMNNNVLRFPNFDFEAFENTLKERIKSKDIKNLASARSYIGRCRFDYGRHPSEDKLWGYNTERYPMTYENGLTVRSIWDMLENYAQEYFIYTMSTSLIISNLAIRSDLDPIDEGFFTLYNQNFFRRDPKNKKEYSAYSHIIDFDLFRIGVQMCNDKNIAGAFEFGIIAVTEIGKERGNNLENKEKKRSAAECNQNTDKFNQWLKMCRHAATVEGYAFIFFICDEQRASSWGADARDLCEVINIEENLEHKTTLIFFILPDLFLEYVIPAYFKWLKKVRNKGNMNVPVVKVLTKTVSAYWRYATKLRNVYGYNVEVLGRESGTLEDKEVKKHDYYILDKKIYSDRYATDCFKDGFAQKALSSGISLYTIDTYQTECAMLEELKQQRSYFANTFVELYLACEE